MNAPALAVISLALGLGGCFMIQGHAEMVKRERGGGVMALKGDRGKAMADAKNQMAANCPAGYEISREGREDAVPKGRFREEQLYRHFRRAGVPRHV